MKLSELSSFLTGVESTLEKVQREIETLKNSMQDQEIPADAQASLDRLSALATALDEANPDEPTEETPAT